MATQNRRTNISTKLRLASSSSGNSFFHVLATRQVAAALELLSPGFMLDMKDTFISLVIDGPFPLNGNSEQKRRERPASNESRL